MQKIQKQVAFFLIATYFSVTTCYYGYAFMLVYLVYKLLRFEKYKMEIRTELNVADDDAVNDSMQ